MPPRDSGNLIKQLLVGEWAAVTRWALLALCIVALFYGDRRYVTVETMRTKELSIVETRKMDLEAINSRFRELEVHRSDADARMRQIENKLERIATDVSWIKTALKQREDFQQP